MHCTRILAASPFLYTHSPPLDIFAVAPYLLESRSQRSGDLRSVNVAARDVMGGFPPVRSSATKNNISSAVLPLSLCISLSLARFAVSFCSLLSCCIFLCIVFFLPVDFCIRAGHGRFQRSAMMNSSSWIRVGVGRLSWERAHALHA
jgi:hypothetical protein